MPNHQIDDIDRKILGILQANAHATTDELSQAVGLSPSPCARRVRILESSGVITRYVAVVDQQRVDLPINVFASIRLERQREDNLDRFAKAVSRWPEIVECYLMTGRQDYLLRIVVKDLPAYEAFLKQKLTRLEGVSSIESSFALDHVKQFEGLPV